ncbi:cytochrome P450 alkane hydroxylase [Aspergillus terreus]|uniref:Cytochrome P450 alkane hydroxylase n=1 Tax=Aspergillus terreus TaxID=33178 RepID=A0A5M3YL90_ASPTE|nr:hypothetical protein ATETN484_0001027100 [Aspergillus terreus]GFF12127.1 cytochrome P450 alkane hydroxylase [Aspergillus terreus]
MVISALVSVEPTTFLKALFGFVALYLAILAIKQRLALRASAGHAVRIQGRPLYFGLDMLWETLMHAKKRQFLDLQRTRFQKYGNTFGTKRLATTVIMTCEPSNIKTILSLRFQDYELKRLSSFGPLLGKGIFTTDGAEWMKSRAMLRPNFDKPQLMNLEMFESLMQEMFELIPDNGDTVDLQKLFFCYTVDSATEFLFGQGVHSLRKLRPGSAGDDTEIQFAAAFNYAQGSARVRHRLGPLKALYHDRKATECNKICHQLAEECIDKALQAQADDASGNNKRYIFLEELLAQTKNRRRIRDELLNILLAGRDTTASLLSNLFFMLARNPHIWQKLRTEVAILDGQTPTYDQLRSFKYLKYCLNESLRVHPVIPVNARFATKDTVLPVGGGPDGQSPAFVPRGSMIVYDVYNMHHRQDLYGPDADEFRPERWEHLRPRWEYLPFNGGPRICLGQQYALTEAGYVTMSADEFWT